MSKIFQIKQASEQTGVHLETIRYYEKQGLIKPTFQANGYRVFDENQLEQLRFIKTCRNIGFSLKDIQVLLTFQTTPNHQCEDNFSGCLKVISPIKNTVFISKNGVC